jgi:hypothetical protein
MRCAADKGGLRICLRIAPEEIGAARKVIQAK